MEAQIAAANESLIPGLEFKLPQAASFIQERESVTFFPEGASTYSPNGVRVLRFTLSDSMAFLDPHTVHLSMTVTNPDDVNPLFFQSQNPATMFSRLRVLCAGTLVEDITHYGRLVNMLDKFLPPQRNESKNTLLGFGRSPASDDIVHVSDGTSAQIGPDASRKVVCPIVCGLLSQAAYLPLKACPVTIELELNSTASNVIVEAGGSTSFTISDCRILSDVVYLDGAMMEQVNKHLLSGSGLPLHFTSWASTMNVVTPSNVSGAFSIQLARAFTRVKTFLATFNNAAGTDGQEIAPFTHPMKSTTYNPDRDTMQWQVHIGARKFPQYPVRSLAESALHLHHALNLTAADEGLGFSSIQFGDTRFFAALNMEKAATGPGAMAAYTGYSTRGGETIRFEVSQINTADGNQPKKCWISLQYDALMRITASGVEVFD